jgi:hypothetical protein
MDNPYQAPLANGAVSGFYKVDSRALTYAEYRRFAGNLLEFGFAALAKVLGITVDFGTALPRLERLIRLQPEQLRPRLRASLRGEVDAFVAQGYTFHFFYTIPFYGNTLGYGAVLSDAGHTSLAQVLFSRTKTGDSVMQRTVRSICSRLRAGEACGVTSDRHTMNQAPWYNVTFMPGASAAALHARHQELIRGNRHVEPLAPDEIESYVIKLSNDALDFNIGRGVYVQVSESELETIESVKPLHRELAADTSAEADRR